MAAELTTLAGAGAAGVVKAMATDLWPRIKAAGVSLLRRTDRSGGRGGVASEDHRISIAEQSNTAKDSGTVFAVQGGSQHVHGIGPTAPGDGPPTVE